MDTWLEEVFAHYCYAAIVQPHTESMVNSQIHTITSQPCRQPTLPDHKHCSSCIAANKASFESNSSSTNHLHM